MNWNLFRKRERKTDRDEHKGMIKNILLDKINDSEYLGERDYMDLMEHMMLLEDKNKMEKI